MLAETELLAPFDAVVLTRLAQPGMVVSHPCQSTPVLTVAARPDNNEVGNRAAVPLAGVADAARPTELRGDAIYRYATVGSDLRNLAVAR